MSTIMEPGVQSPVNFEAILQQLSLDPEAIEWSGRRRLVETLAQILERSAPDAYMLALAKLFCQDPKWEVRYASVDLMQFLWASEMDFSLQQLRKDPCPRVKHRADRFVQEREERKRSARDKHKKLRDYRSRMQRLNSEVGEEMVAEFCKLVDYEKAILISKLTHDLARLVSSIDQNTATIQAQLDSQLLDKDIIRKAVRDNRDQTDHLTRLTEDLRTYVGQEVAGKYLVSIRSMIDWAVETAGNHFRQRFEEKDIPKVVVHISDLLSAEVAMHSFRMALANVVQNAMEACRGRRGRVNIFCIAASSKCDDPSELDVEETAKRLRRLEKIKIVVRDNGPGFERHTLRLINECVPGVTTKGTRGTGFGLAIARKTVEWHEGTLEILSKEGVGSDVSIIIPRKQAEKED